jgi:RimJ/RimL family protein N-acetyltransferase
MTSHLWPLRDLRIRTPQLELRIPSQDDLEALAELAAGDIHDPSEMPFGMPWTDAPPEERARGTLQHHWGQWAQLRPESWNLNLVTVVEGHVVGTQSIGARSFPICREVHTGSWLGRPHQRQGIGTAMRVAVLDFAFFGLIADWAASGAFLDNAASITVSRKLGYADDGIEVRVRRNEAATLQRFRMSRETWLARNHTPATIEGLQDVARLLGL